jgi:Lamin Tail Domain
MKKALLALLCFTSFTLSAQIVITEIMYNPPESGTDSLEYIELFNAGTAAVDISGYTMVGVTHTFPAGTSMAAGSYIVLAKSNSAMRTIFGRAFTQWTDGALTNSGETVGIRTAAGVTVDEVSYGSGAPWPSTPNGNGPSLVLCDPASDNALPANWQAATTPSGRSIAGIAVIGNPGAASQCNFVPPVTTYPLRTIAQMITDNAQGVADSLGKTCELRGTALGVNLRSVGLEFTLTDGTTNNGIGLFRNLGNFGYTVREGDAITVRGRIGQFNGLTQLNLDTVIRTGTGTVPTPEVVLRLSEATESKLVQVRNLRLVSQAAWTMGVGTGGFTVRGLAAGTRDTIVIRVNSATDLFNNAGPRGLLFNITGIASQFDATQPYTTGYQLVPRYVRDLDLSVRTEEADYNDQIQIAPNPITTTLNIQMDLAFDRLQVIRMDGVVMYDVRQPQPSEIIDTANWPVGVYAIRFEKGQTFWTDRVVKF